MRLWTLHPGYLDPQGLVALWREALLAQAVLAGRTQGYRHHPQLQRFAAQPDALMAVNAYLAEVLAESQRRGYRFDASKVPPVPAPMRSLPRRGSATTNGATCAPSWPRAARPGTPAGTGWTRRACTRCFVWSPVAWPTGSGLETRPARAGLRPAPLRLERVQPDRGGVHAQPRPHGAGGQGRQAALVQLSSGAAAAAAAAAPGAAMARSARSRVRSGAAGW
jgi:hypothetical protein